MRRNIEDEKERERESEGEAPLVRFFVSGGEKERREIERLRGAYTLCLAPCPFLVVVVVCIRTCDNKNFETKCQF